MISTKKKKHQYYMKVHNLARNNPGLWMEGIPTQEMLSREILQFCSLYDVNSFLIAAEDSQSFIIKSHPAAEIYAITPNVSRYVREMTIHGQTKTALKIILRMGINGLALTIIKCVRNLPQLLQKDFRVMLSLLISIELQELRHQKPKIVFLHNQITDLALANNNKEIILAFINALKKSCAEPGLI